MANKKVRICQTFDKNSANVKSKAGHGGTTLKNRAFQGHLFLNISKGNDSDDFVYQLPRKLMVCFVIFFSFSMLIEA